MERTVWIVTYDWGDYGNGIAGVFSTKAKAEGFVDRKKGGYGSYDIDERTVDEEA